MKIVNMAKQKSPKNTTPVTIRITIEMNDRIEQRLKISDEFKNRSDFIYRATFHYLNELDDRDNGREFKVKLDPLQ